MPDMKSVPYPKTYRMLLTWSGTMPCSPNSLPMVSKAIAIHGSQTSSPVAAFLSCRSHRVALNGVLSSPLPVQAGVPQSSALGRVLFLVVINDLSDSLKNPLYLFADDSTLCRTICHPSDRQATASALCRSG